MSDQPILQGMRVIGVAGADLIRIEFVLEASHARSCAGVGARDTGEPHHASAVRLLEQARAVIGTRHAW